MPTVVEFKGVAITAAYSGGSGQIGPFEWDGEVTFTVRPADPKVGGVQFDYVCQFKRATDLAQAIQDAGVKLRTEVAGLMRAVDAIRYGP